MHALVAGQLLYLLGMAVDARFLDSIIPARHRLSQPYAWVLYLEQHAPPHATVAVLDAGFVAYRLPLTVRIVDMVGLADEHIAHLPPQFLGGMWGQGDAWGRWDVDYVLAQEPDYIQFPGAPDAQGHWETGSTGTTLLANDTRFQQNYRPAPVPWLYERVITTTDD